MQGREDHQECPQTFSDNCGLSLNRNGENFVVLSEADWQAMEETVYLNQVPGLTKSILKAAAEPLEDGTSLEDLEW